MKKYLLTLPLLLLYMFIPFIVNAKDNYLTVKWYEYKSIPENIGESNKDIIALSLLMSVGEIYCNNNDTNLTCYNKNNLLLVSGKKDEAGNYLIKINENLTTTDNIKYTFSQQIKEEIENNSSLSLLRGYDGIYFMLVEEDKEQYDITGNCNSKAISISSIKINRKDENVTEIQKITANGNVINLNISMVNVGDSIEYEVIVNNYSNEDYIIDKNSFNLKSKYIDYNISSTDNSNIVKAQSSKKIYLNVKYRTEVPDEAFENGIFKDNLSMTVNLSNKNNTTKGLINPKTGIQYYALIITTILIIGIIIFKKLKQKKYAKFILLILTTIIIPISAYALCNIEIKINSTINITKETGTFCIKKSILSDEKLYFEYNKGDTLKNYYTNIINNIDNYNNYSIIKDNNSPTRYYLYYEDNQILGFYNKENNDEYRFYYYVNHFTGREFDFFKDSIIDSIYGCYYVEKIN